MADDVGDGDDATTKSLCVSNLAARYTMLDFSLLTLALVAPLSPLRPAHTSTHSRAAASSIRASSYFIGIDSGTQSTKALVYDTDTKEVLGVGAVPHGTVSTDK